MNYQSKIQALRDEYKTALPENRKMIEIRAKLLKIAWAKSQKLPIEQIEVLI
jgi:hypothetical protein